MRELLQLILQKRFRRVISLFLIFVVQYWLLAKKKRFLAAAETDYQYRKLYKKQAVKFTATAIDLGGLLIKLGQFFSSRVDILPKEYTDELSKLQDMVEPVDTSLIRSRISEELGGPLDKIFPVFSSQAMAAASLGQVHRAQLPGGEEVAVKVLRPGIEETVAIDFKVLKLIITFAKRYPRIKNVMDLDQIYYEFKETISDELDYIKEAQNSQRFSDTFAKDARVYVPRVYTKYSAKKVLTMEFVSGVKINDLEFFAREGVNRKEIAETLLSIYLRQVLVEGFYHADPHPGNILVRADGVLVLLDFGMVGRLDKQMKDSMAALALGLFKRDAGAVVEAFDRLEFLKPHADRGVLKKSVRLMFANMFQDSIDITKVDFNELAIDLRELMYSQPFQLPAQTTFLGKALITVFGLCNELDEEFDFMRVVNPYIEQVFQPGAEVTGDNIVLDQAKKILFEVLGLPEKINRFMDGFEAGEIRIHPSRSFEQKLFEHQDNAVNRIVLAILAVGCTVTGSQLLSMFYEVGIFLLVIGGFFALMVLRRGTTRTGRPKPRGMRNLGSGFKKPKYHP